MIAGACESGSAVMNKPSHLIGIFCDHPMIGSAYFGMLQVGLMAGCRIWDCALLTKSFDISDTDIPDRVKQLHKRSPLRGVVLPEPMCAMSDLVDALSVIRLPTVRITPPCEVRKAYDICVDNRRGAHDVTDYLIGLGHKRIAFIKGPPDHSDANERFEAFRQAMAEAGLPVLDELCVQAVTFNYHSGLTAAEQLLSAAPMPTAVFACNDELAAAMLAVASGKGLAVPGDLSVVGFDDAPVARSVRPQLTTCRQDMELIGYLAVEFIMNPAASPEISTCYQPHELVIRDSAAPPKPL
jgi:LacI family transcriptional regulator, galactose operon repressor